MGRGSVAARTSGDSPGQLARSLRAAGGVGGDHPAFPAFAERPPGPTARVRWLPGVGRLSLDEAPGTFGGWLGQPGPTARDGRPFGSAGVGSVSTGGCLSVRVAARLFAPVATCFDGVVEGFLPVGGSWLRAPGAPGASGGRGVRRLSSPSGLRSLAPSTRSVLLGARRSLVSRGFAAAEPRRSAVGTVRAPSTASGPYDPWRRTRQRHRRARWRRWRR